MNPIKIAFATIKNFKTKIQYPNLNHAYNIKSHLTIQERAQLYKLSISCEYVTEIGSYIGASASCFGAAAIERRGKKIICIDTWNNDAMSEGIKDTWSEFTKNTNQYKEYINPIRGFSTDVIDSVKKITDRIDLLFIDGDHSYTGVNADWEGYKSFLKEGSIVVFHDYGWADGVKRVIKEDVMKRVDYFDMLPNMWWGKISK